ncbi:unnamed protein product [Notodromas monacha]|uniref:Protein LTV1 homolog n=1 Tax=Notodromas monacha TaxID=399045 RepID=A0A7R9BPF0_9CRUS|nr:unnamed protein product [Notodromas monacha]CAG0918386.1 unnamed protein product [Notodromas monacha]
MGKKSRKFIDKKKAVTFHLVHRSQRDPLVVDENAPDRVLLEAAPAKRLKNDPSYVKRKEEERKYGVYFDDDYDYLQHLRTTDEFRAELEPVERFRIDPVPPRSSGKNLNLPSSVFESAVKEKVGMLNRAAPISGPRLDFDPDVAAALDDDFNFDDPENELEDDFVMQACAAPGDDEEESGDSDDDEDSEDEYSDEEAETKSRAFTNYSMTSSVIRRWVIHLVPRKTYNTDVSKIFGLGQQGVVESMFVAAGTQNCVTELSSSSSSDDDKQASLLMMMLLNNDSSSSRAGILLYPRSFGPYTHWMNSQEIILFSKPKFQGKQVNIKLFDNDTVSHIEDFDTGFFPMSSIVINSDWNINTGEDVFCLLGRNDVVFLSDWVSEGYISKPATLKKMMGNHSQNNNDYQQQQQQELFPQVEPGCYSRPQQVAELLDKPWSGTHFCHFAQVS